MKRLVFPLLSCVILSAALFFSPFRAVKSQEIAAPMPEALPTPVARDFPPAILATMFATHAFETSWTGIVTEVVRVNSAAKPMDDSFVHWDVSLLDPSATPTPKPTPTPTPTPTPRPTPTPTPTSRSNPKFEKFGFVDGGFTWDTSPGHHTPIPIPTPKPTPKPTLFDLPALITPRTMILTQSGDWRGASSIRRGQKVRVIGSKPQYNTYRSAARVLILPDDSPPSGLENISPPPRGKAFWEQTKGNVTLRVTSAGWFSPPRIYRSDKPEPRAFMIGGEIRGPLPRRVADYGARMTLDDMVSKIQIGGSPGYDSHSTRLNQRFAVWKATVKPAYKATQAQIVILDPLAPAGSDGVTHNLLFFPDLPNKTGVHHLNISRRLPSGTVVTLSKLSVGLKNLGLVFDVKLPPNAPVTEFDFQAQLMRPKGGAPLLTDGSVSGWYQNTYEAGAKGRPPASVSRFGLDVMTVEKAPSRADSRWLHRFQIPLSPQKLHAQPFGTSPAPSLESFFE